MVIKSLFVFKVTEKSEDGTTTKTSTVKVEHVEYVYHV